MGIMAQWYLRKADRFLFSDVNDLGTRSRNDVDLQYSLTFINSNTCLHVLSFRSQAAILSEKSTVFAFSYRNAYEQNFTLA